jgi:hypothetical protein
MAIGNLVPGTCFLKCTVLSRFEYKSDGKPDKKAVNVIINALRLCTVASQRNISFSDILYRIEMV